MTMTMVPTVLLLLSAARSAAAAAVAKPHIVFALTDDLGWNYPGYHNPEVNTPTLDLLAKQGVRLESHCEDKDDAIACYSLL